MPHEITDWKKENCSLSFQILKLSSRETFSREINEKYGEGGGLNADYRTVEAIAKAANILGLSGLKYGEDFIFKTADLDEILFDFANQEIKVIAKEILQKFS